MCSRKVKKDQNIRIMPVVPQQNYGQLSDFKGINIQITIHWIHS
jgi:hypothetical protein